MPITSLWNTSIVCCDLNRWFKCIVCQWMCGLKKKNTRKMDFDRWICIKVKKIFNVKFHLLEINPACASYFQFFKDCWFLARAFTVHLWCFQFNSLYINKKLKKNHFKSNSRINSNRNEETKFNETAFVYITTL